MIRPVRNPCYVAALAIWALCVGNVLADPGQPSDRYFEGTAQPLVAKYCVGCHGGDKPKGELALDKLGDPTSDAKHRDTWAKIVENLEAGVMPPEGEPKPTVEQVAELTQWATDQLSRPTGAERDPGRVTMRRLNRAEYNNTIRDLVGVDFQPADAFPSDDVGYGFDNIGDVLSIPPLLMEKYLAAAEEVANRAILVPEPAKTRTKRFGAKEFVPLAGYARDDQWVLATAGEVAADVFVLGKGKSTLRVRAHGDQAGNEPVKLALRVDGNDVAMVEVKGGADQAARHDSTLDLPFGKHRISIAFLNDYFDPANADASRRDRNLIVEELEIVGPVGKELPPIPASHGRIIIRRPEGDDWGPAAREIVARFAERAYRRPVQDEEIDRLVELVKLAQSEGDPFERGVQLAVSAILASPHFLFRVELDGKADGHAHPINDYQLASRLSYFLWSTMPDDELWQLAKVGKLRDGLEPQVKRMLADSRSATLVENFASQWLQLRNLSLATPDRRQFESFDEPLRIAMQRETELFFESIVREDRSILELLTADYTFVNERLAKHYGLPDVKGDEFRRVTLPKGPRGGLLTQASILTVTSNPTRTSPVKRGKWILEQILGTPPPPPPAGVGELEEVKVSGSLREKMEQHRANPNCATCHNRMDPLGFGLENFDAIGAWREKDGDFAIDASGTLPGGKSFRGPEELRRILSERQDQFRRNLARKLLTYALGRGLEPYDGDAVRRVCDATASADNRFSALVLAIVRSEPFQMRRGLSETELIGGQP